MATTTTDTTFRPLTLLLLVLLLQCFVIECNAAVHSAVTRGPRDEKDKQGNNAYGRGLSSARSTMARGPRAEDDNRHNGRSSNGGARGPRGSLHPGSSKHRRHLQPAGDNMGARPLAEGYGGVGGPSMTTSETLDMRPQVVPITPTFTPLTPPPVTTPPMTPPPVTKPPITPPPVTTAPTPDARVITFVPGLLSVMEMNGDLLLSQGLTARLIAVAGQPVQYADGTSSDIDFHEWPDGAACFADNRAGNTGGWVYVSNLEDKKGGVGAITFDANGNVLDYKMVLEGSRYNCNGGKTPWDSFISAEEDFDKGEGRPWQVDPYGIRDAETINMGLEGGSYEAFAYDVRNTMVPRFFLTEDSVFGALERFTPTAPNWNDPWSILLGPGVHQWLLLTPNPTNNNVGTYSWTTDWDLARSNAAMHYPESEGIDVAGSNLCFVCKGIKMLFTLDLDGNTYTRQSTSNGLFEGEPDMIQSILSEEPEAETLLYFTEDNGRRAGIHARNSNGELMTILEGFYSPETTGLALSPDGKFLHVCFQEDGLCFMVRRTDGLSFGAKTLNVKRHPTEGSARNQRDLKETRKAYRERRFVSW